MSNDTKNSLTLGVNTILTALTTALLAVCGWLVQGELKTIRDGQVIALQQMQAAADNKYETQPNHDKDVTTLRESQSKAWTQMANMENKMDDYHSQSMQEFGKLDTEYQVLMNAVENNKGKAN
jgi:hypothetical protein